MIHKLVELTKEEKDYPGSSMLQWFVDEQVEEEAQTDEIVQKLKMVSEKGPGMLMLDRELGKRKAD